MGLWFTYPTGQIRVCKIRFVSTGENHGKPCLVWKKSWVFDDYQRIQLYLSHVMILWHFSSSVNSFFKHACAAPSDIKPHWMAAHACLKNEFTEGEKCHNIMTRHNFFHNHKNICCGYSLELCVALIKAVHMNIHKIVLGRTVDK